jgi:predicted MPP superfamily phosphohydrolase
VNIHSIQSQNERRAAWRDRRRAMEASSLRFTPDGARHRRLWSVFESVSHLADWSVWAVGLHRWGMRNALDIRLAELEIGFPDLPPAFDGYRILHLTDTHLDELPELSGRAAELVRAAPADLLALTGDYRAKTRGPYERALELLAPVVEAACAPDGKLALLGNHDSAEMAPALERLGLRVLVNESVALRRGGEALSVTGLDDVHYFYTDEAPRALGEAPPGFRIALVHSPEFADFAAEAGCRLYLCGHTHGGQICLPGGRAVVTHLARCKGFARGRWRCGAMEGYTSCGLGVSGAPLRFNSRGEAALITLRRSA